MVKFTKTIFFFQPRRINYCLMWRKKGVPWPNANAINYDLEHMHSPMCLVFQIRDAALITAVINHKKGSFVHFSLSRTLMTKLSRKLSKFKHLFLGQFEKDFRFFFKT